MATYSFADHLNANKLFHKALSELRALIERGVDNNEALDLIIRAYTDPLVRKFYAPVLHAWAMKLKPPAPVPVKTYQEEYTAALERIAVLEQELVSKEEEVTSLRAQAEAREADVKPSEEESVPVADSEVVEKEETPEEVYEVVLPGRAPFPLTLKYLDNLLREVLSEFAFGLFAE